jgi:transcriptional regulator with XRE-family HTH domain
MSKLKEDVGIRFKAFRIDQKKAQHVLATELKVHQSTITNIEHGTTFPKISYLFYFYETYGLNINWLITGDGEMYLRDRIMAEEMIPLMLPHVQYEDPQYHQYLELTRLMEVPAIEQVILAKLTESKIIFKEQVQEFLREKKEKELREAEEAAAEAEEDTAK